MIQGVHHAAIICSDYVRSRAFYTEILGFLVRNEVYREDRRSYKLDLQLPDGTSIELFSFPDPPARASYPEACGLRHLALRVDDIEAAIATLTARGVAVQEIRLDQFTGRRFAFFEDPDGLPIELYENETARRLISAEELTLEAFVRCPDLLTGILRLEPWKCLDAIDELLASIIPSSAGGGVFVHPEATIEPGAVVKPPAFISARCFVASGAYLRGGVFLAPQVSIGPGCEVKSSLVFESACLAHLNFIGDSIIGSHVNFEAGSHTANHWNERQDAIVHVQTSTGPVSTGRKKLGSVVGDGSRIGANAVLAPGTLLLPGSVVPRLTYIEQLRCARTPATNLQR